MQEIWNFGNLMAVTALSLSIYNTWRAHQRDKKTILKEMKANLVASFNKISSGNYELIIRNNGKGSARNVNINFLLSAPFFYKKDIEQMLMYKILEPTNRFSLRVAGVGIATPRKHELELLWDDDFRRNNKKMVTPTLQL
jgi:hypothetical protein